MVLESVGIEVSEMELARIVGFKPLRGVSPKMMEKLCEMMDLNFEYHFDSSLNEIKQNIENGFYPIVLVNPSVLCDVPEEEHGHYIVIKDITKEKIIVNDPDQEYGGENKEIDLKRFIEAWKRKYKLIFVIKGERK